ncbi:unnamed protein product [Adineta steineri]|uniref:Uncharacterized protein n=1 Tax=Adineta steineri TaxID=433720 RepID=A0A814RS79_9BILA|nr:unnamed protein product [Adineta steineri]CAF1283848.1 unnamed protein product [Adineta steineri]
MLIRSIRPTDFAPKNAGFVRFTAGFNGIFTDFGETDWFWASNIGGVVSDDFRTGLQPNYADFKGIVLGGDVRC